MKNASLQEVVADPQAYADEEAVLHHMIAGTLVPDDIAHRVDERAERIMERNNVATTTSANPKNQLKGTSVDTLSQLGFDFPILDNPLRVVGMLLGQDATFVTWNTPTLHANFTWSNTYYPLSNIPVLYVTIAAGIKFDAGATFGFDSEGLHTGNFFDGFFVQGGVQDAQGNWALAALQPSLTATAGIGPGDINFQGFSIAGILNALGSNLNNFLTLDISATLSALIEINLNNQDWQGRVRFTVMNFSNPVNVALSGVTLTAAYDAAIKIPNPLAIFGAPKNISIGPGHVIIGTFTLWPPPKNA